jgi:hypothetical protein
MTRQELLGGLDGLNRSLRRQHAEPLITRQEAVALTDANLALIVDLTAERVLVVARALAGRP